MKIPDTVLIWIHTLENSHTDCEKMVTIVKIQGPCELSRSRTFNVILHNVALEIDAWSNILGRNYRFEDI